MYSYWNGCSQGGRQGLMLAQRYPTAYDGIGAGAPAINWNKLIDFVQWPQQVMNEMGEFPYGCELDAITAAAVSACDKLDGVVDGIISNIKECLDSFDPFSVVGDTVTCAQTNGTQKLISQAAAVVANATWHGRVTADGMSIHHGIGPGSDLTGNSPKSYGSPGVAATSCTEKGCTGSPSNLGTSWFRLFLAKNPAFDLTNLTRKEFDALAYTGVQQYASLMETADADLREFRNAGGKMVTFHGLVCHLHHLYRETLRYMITAS